MAKHAVVRTDLMSGSENIAALASVKYMGAEGTEPAEIDNGNVVKVGALVEGEREVFVGTDVEATTPLSEVVLVAAPELMYDERLKNLDDFVNPAGKPFRGYRLISGNIFGVTKEALVGEPAVGDVVELKAGTKLEVKRSASSAATLVGEVIAIDQAGRYEYIVIRVK